MLTTPRHDAPGQHTGRSRKTPEIVETKPMALPQKMKALDSAPDNAPAQGTEAAVDLTTPEVASVCLYICAFLPVGNIGWMDGYM